ncbi:hypothetical protein LUX05_20300 [Streptomyces somaliensis]|nr:hypothetical protein [Streptomyces somaliensis]
MRDGTFTDLAAPAPPPGPGPATRPLGEVRTWPRSFADRLTAPLPGVHAFARLAREGSAALRPGSDGLRDVPKLPFAPGPPPPAARGR